MSTGTIAREGSLEAPTRHNIDWEDAEFYHQEALDAELERVFDICHGCRRCVSLCDAFPTLFDLVDESDTLEVDGVDKKDYVNVADECYLCDMCYMTKCPYVPPHAWAVDFPHLMLRTKAVKFKRQGASLRDRTITSTDMMGKLGSIPLLDVTINAMNNQPLFRQALEKTLKIHHAAPLPQYHSKTLRKRTQGMVKDLPHQAVNGTTGKVALFATCYGNFNSPSLGDDFFKVFQHNDIQLELTPRENCCGMPKMELGDLESVRKLKDANIPMLADLVDQGYDLIGPVPSCVLMFKQELPLMFPHDEQVKKVQKAFFDPFEYLWLRHKGNALKTDFKAALGDISYQVACHLRVQNIGMKTRDVLHLVPDTQVAHIERCSGHDGTYAVRLETRDSSVKIARPVVRKVNEQKAEHFVSDCPMAATHIAHLADENIAAEHPMTLLRVAYGLA
ncbi:MAG: heterodisulfide reductase-related iron-sulfur binding cluster [Natronospirillum sp.]